VDDLLTRDKWVIIMTKSTSMLPIAVIASLLLASRPVQANDKGTPEAARAMLERAVEAIKANEPEALQDFNTGAAGFRDRDLYVFCARFDGKVDAHVDPAQIGKNIKDLYDIDGVAFGQEMMTIAKLGEVKAVSYMWPEPASHTPVNKVTFFTRVADQVCGVGYYK
jgi:signal transduction histidine kinase